MTPFSKWKTIGYAVALFITGGISGGALGVYETHAHMYQPVREEEMVLRLRRRLETRLDLTPDQVAKINPIIVSAVRNIRSIRTESAQRVISVLDDSYAQVAAVLTPQQRVVLDKMKRERYDMMQRYQAGMRGHNGPGGGFGGPGSGFNRTPGGRDNYGGSPSPSPQ